MSKRRALLTTVRIVVVGIIAAFATSCRSEDRVLSPQMKPAASIQNVASGNARLSADVEVTMPALMVNFAGQAPSLPTLTYHLEQTRDTAGLWHTAYSDLAPPDTRIPGIPQRPPVS